MSTSARAFAGEAFVPIRRYLEGQVFDPETIESMGRALAGTCEALGLRPGDDAITRRVALRIIELARDGERDSEQLKDAALKSFQH